MFNGKTHYFALASVNTDNRYNKFYSYYCLRSSYGRVVCTTAYISILFSVNHAMPEIQYFLIKVSGSLTGGRFMPYLITLFHCKHKQPQPKFKLSLLIPFLSLLIPFLSLFILFYDNWDAIHASVVTSIFNQNYDINDSKILTLSRNHVC